MNPAVPPLKTKLLTNSQVFVRQQKKLRDLIVDNALHYQTEQQAVLWEKVARKHSPAHSKKDFEALYLDAFKTLLDPPSFDSVVGIGSGTGSKELLLAHLLVQSGKQVPFTFVDCSETLLQTCASQISSAGLPVDALLCCDIIAEEDLIFLKNEMENRGKKLFTFFGLLPTLSMDETIYILSHLLAPKDCLMINAFLIPSTEVDVDLVETLKNKIVPQYDNSETREWISEFLKSVGWRGCPSDLVFGIKENFPFFTIEAEIVLRDDLYLERYDCFWPKESKVSVFRSMRASKSGMDCFLKSCQMSVLFSRVEASGEEGIWVAQKA